MPPQSKTATSTPRRSDPRLSEYARSFVFPPTIVRTVWPRVEAKGREVGLGFDWWQAQLGTVCLGYREDGRYAATVGGIGMSIPRQVGKTYFVLAMLVILCLLFPGLQVVWTAHHLRTSTKTFTALRGICRRRGVAPHVLALRSANGEQQASFRNGSVIMFGARSQGFGRGFDEIDIEVFDEAQILDTRALEDMIAATNQARHEHGALLFFMGTPPRPNDPAEAFSLRRKEAISGEAEDAIWLEIGADPDSSPDDRAQWPLMNPSFPLRTPLESMLRLRKNLGNEDSWNREGRGIWDDDTVASVFGAGRWAACRTDKPPACDLGWLGVAVAVDLRSASLVGVGDADGVAVVKPLAHGPGTDWLVDEVERQAVAYDVPVVIDQRGPGAVMLPELRERLGSRLYETSTADVLDACAWMFKRVRAKTVSHGGYPELDTAADVAVQRPVGDRWAWGRRKSQGDISPLEAATLAVWALDNAKPKSAPPPDIF